MKSLALTGILSLGMAASAFAQQSKGEVPSEYKPPKGMCRIWLKDVPAKQQPAPTDCAAAVKNVPPNGRVIFGDSDDKKEKEKPKADSLPANVKGFTGKGPTPIKPPIKPPASLVRRRPFTET